MMSFVRLPSFADAVKAEAATEEPFETVAILRLGDGSAMVVCGPRGAGKSVGQLGRNIVAGLAPGERAEGEAAVLLAAIGMTEAA